MVITLVIDQYVGNDGKATNGTTMTCLRFAEKFREHGHTVKIITGTENDDENVCVMPTVKVPILQKIIEAQGMCFAKMDEKKAREALKGTDVVHFLMPFGLQKNVKKIADEMDLPTTAAFHVQPENMTYSVGLGKIAPVNKIIYLYFKNSFFHKFNHIHCPSNMIKNQLVKNHYKGNLHVISNGVEEGFKKMDVERPEKYKNKIVLLKIGRLSKEKRQDLIIKAIAKSKYKDKIVFVDLGRGPWKDGLLKMAAKYGVNVDFTTAPREEVVKVINYSDLYVHASDIEIEAIGCIEAFTCGLPPIISDSKLSATNQFALSEHNLFKHGNYNDLTKKIDFMIEHPEIKADLSKKYIEYAKQYQLDHCVRELEKVFQMAIDEKKAEIEERKKYEGLTPKVKKLKKEQGSK